MKLAIMQPYFMPYIGYWQLIKAVDKYVIYDDVNFIKKGWINRNNLLINGEKNLYTITLNDASQNRKINEISIQDDFQKISKTIELNYCKAPYYDQIMPIIKSIFCFPDKNLANFITNSFHVINSYLGIDTELILSSSINKDNNLSGKDKILHICEILGASNYINAIGGQDLYEKKEFEAKGVHLNFLSTDKDITYKQFKSEFIPSLSIIDVLMFNSPNEIDVMLNKYELL